MKPKQAVIVIHGIGEQIPMATLRGLVRGLGFDFYYNRPDRVSGNSELRRITLPRRGKNPRVDFFELYWAHQMHRRAGFGTLAWILALVNRVRKATNSLLRTTFTLATIAAVMALIVAAKIVFSEAGRQLLTLPVTVGIVLLLVIVATVAWILIRTARHVIGDAARYPDPDRAGKQPIAKNWRDHLPEHADHRTIEDFQRSQHLLWREQRSRGVPWLVTDFITLGSPLAHAPILL